MRILETIVREKTNVEREFLVVALKYNRLVKEYHEAIAQIIKEVKP